MRLLRINESGHLSFTRDLSPGHIPPYGILSHTWGADEDELTFGDIRNGTGKNKSGYQKVLFCGKQAKKDGLEYFWVDSCCIDKGSSAELTEAINSMFRWYKEARKCYVYLTDVSTHKRDDTGGNRRAWDGSFRTSRWFTRGWTLQELIAPTTVEFFSQEEEYLGNKATLQQMIMQITGIPVAALRGNNLSDFGVSERLRWAAKRTTKKLEDKSYCMLGIFGVTMPLVYGEGADAEVRLKDQISRIYRIQLDAPLEINRSPGSLTKADDMKEYREKLLASLEFAQMDSRRSTIKNSYSTTCEWLLTHPQYMAWSDPSKFHQHHGFLWINGNPGTGKSTLMKFAHSHADRERHEGEIVLCFFFNARGETLERSTSGMYKALLYQLLDEAADLREALDVVVQNKKAKIHDHTWTNESLKAVMSAAILRLKARRLRIFIDALDECKDEEIREMIEFFEEVGCTTTDSGSQVFMCFASRHYPTIHIKFGNMLILEAETGHNQDLRKYVEARLQAGAGQHVDEVRMRILEKANGVFMWVVLVIEMLNNEFRRGRIFAVKKRLEELPPKLSDLFKDMLRRDGTDIEDMLICLQWVLFAYEPLSPREFYFAVVSGLDSGADSIGSTAAAQVDDESLNRFVHTSSKGLAEITRSAEPRVQFIHESVQDFLISEGGLYEVWPELAHDVHSACHERLKQCCHNYLLANTPDEINEILATEMQGRYPFLRYATRHILHHANNAVTTIIQDDFLMQFPLKKWLNAANKLFRESEKYTATASLVYILAEHNYSRLIEPSIRMGYPFTGGGKRYCYPFVAACANGHVDACKALLDSVLTHAAPDDLSETISTTSREYERMLNTLSDGKGRNGLLVASRRRREHVVRFLLDMKSIDINAKDEKGETALMISRRHLDLTDFSMLLKAGANMEATDHRGCTALLRVGISNGVTSAYVDEPVSFGSSSISPERFSADGGFKNHWDILFSERLLDEGANIEARDSGGQSLLMIAAGLGRVDIAQLLLHRGANIEATDYHGCTALMKAARVSERVLVQRLLEWGANIDAVDNDGKTALHWAIVNPKRARPAMEIGNLLIEHGADINTADTDGLAARRWARVSAQSNTGDGADVVDLIMLAFSVE